MLTLNKQQQQRLCYLAIVGVGVALAVGLILYSLKQNLNLFFTPTQALQADLPVDHRFRLGGQVKVGSVRREKNQLIVHFILTDGKQDIAVTYTGILPDLFRAGNGALADGYFNAQRIFIATAILAKHDENYMPRALYDALRKQ